MIKTPLVTNGRNHNDTDLRCVVQMDDTGEITGNILTVELWKTTTIVAANGARTYRQEETYIFEGMSKKDGVRI